jgi:CheY-like chemotaxis protein
MSTSLQLQRRRVLVVDDNLDHVQSLALLLKSLGHETEFAITGQAALIAARRFRPDVVILDLGLPDMDGVLVCRQLKQELGFEHVRILVVTGSGRDGDRERVIDAGCDQFLQKPVDPRFFESYFGRRHSG